MSTITIIEPTRPLHSGSDWHEDKKKRVAAYARVSTDQEEQLSSLQNQTDYYKKYIMSKSDWEFAGIYSDEGISGTSTKRREGLKQMLRDADDGEIDIILTKSVSRLARNVVDAVEITRHLKSVNVEVIFEKENLSTFDPNSELVFNIMSTLAMEESRSLSENVRWGKMRRERQGKIDMSYKRFLGYQKGADGKPEIVESEAKIVRLIFQMASEGVNTCSIARHLTENHYKTPGGQAKWYTGTVRSILRNEKYKGDVITHKTFTKDYLNKKVYKNEGQVGQVIIRGHHPAIIDEDTFELVQQKLEEWKIEMARDKSKSPLSGKIVCGRCNAFLTHSNFKSGKTRKYYQWLCPNRYPRATATCETPRFRDEYFEIGYLHAFNQLLAKKAEILRRCGKKLEGVSNKRSKLDMDGITNEYNEKRNRIVAELDQLAEELETPGQEDTARLEKCSEELFAEAEALQIEIKEIKDTNISLIKEQRNLNETLTVFENQSEKLTAFDGDIFKKTVDYITVNPQTFVYHFYGGIEVSVKIKFLEAIFKEMKREARKKWQAEERDSKKRSS